MLGASRPRQLVRLLPLVGLAASLCACQMFGGGAGANATTKVAAKDKPIDIRHYLGPDYCPEIRVRTGSELLRKYEAGHDGEAASVVWQASIGKTARECLYDGQGGLTLKVGASGRVAAGPKGGPGSVTVPLRIALVKYKEAILANDLYPLAVTIPPENSAVFNEVHEITTPSPGEARDYVLYIGLDEKGEGLIDGRPLVVDKPKPVVKPKPALVVQNPRPQRQAQPRQQKQEANVLPVPTSGFVLPGN